MQRQIIPLLPTENLTEIYEKNDNFIIIYNTEYKIFTNPEKINKNKSHAIAGFSINNKSKNKITENETKIVIGVCTGYKDRTDLFYSALYQIIAFNQLDGLMQTEKINVDKIYYIDDGRKQNEIYIEIKPKNKEEQNMLIYIKYIFYYKLFSFANKYNFKFTFSENHDIKIKLAYKFEDVILSSATIKQNSNYNFHIYMYEHIYSTQTNHNYNPIFKAININDSKKTCSLELKNNLNKLVFDNINDQWMNIIYSYLLYDKKEKLTNKLNSSDKISIFTYLLSSTELIGHSDNLGAIWTIYNFYKKIHDEELNKLIISEMKQNDEISFFYIGEHVVRRNDKDDKIEAKFYDNAKFFDLIDENFDLDSAYWFGDQIKANLNEIGLEYKDGKSPDIKELNDKSIKIYNILLRSIFICDYACEKYNKMYGFYKIYHAIDKNKKLFEVLIAYNRIHLAILLVIYLAYMDKKENILALIENYKTNRLEVFELLLFDKYEGLYEFLINKLKFTIKNNKKVLFIDYIFSTANSVGFINNELNVMDKLYFLLIIEKEQKKQIYFRGFCDYDYKPIEDELMKFLFDLGDKKIHINIPIVLLEVKYFLTLYSKELSVLMDSKKDYKILLKYNLYLLDEDVFIKLIRDRNKLLFNILKLTYYNDVNLISDYNNLFQIIYIYI
jgi:hypothetical protein